MNSKHFWLVLLAATLAGTAGLFIKSMTISPVSQAWLRLSLPTIVMGIWLWWEGTPLFRGNWRKMSLISVMGTVRMVFFFMAYTFTSIGNAVIMFYTFPIFSAFLSHLLLKEKISQRQKILLGVAFLGIVLAFSNKEFSFGNRDFLGMSASIISAIIYSLTVVLFKSEAKNYSFKEMVFYQNFSGLFLLLPFFQFQKALPLDYVLGLGYGLLIGVLVFSLFFFGLKKLKASTASAIMYMEVVSAIVLSYLFMDENLSLPMIIGGVMIIGSSLLLRKQ